MTRQKEGLWLLIIRKDQVFIPTMARTEAGFYMGIEPVEIVEANAHEKVENAMIRSVGRGNPIISTPSRDSYPESPLLKYAKVKTASTFERSAQSWKLSIVNDAYEIGPYKKVKPAGSIEDLGRTEALPISEPLTVVVHRLVERALGKPRPTPV